MHLRRLTMTWVALGAAVAAYGQENTTTLSTTAGEYVRLRDVFRGRPSVVFYEDKDSTSANQELKDALFREGRERNLLEAASVVAIANVQGFNWFPARNFVIAAVKKTEAEAKVPVYLDWTGEMTRKPWALGATGSTVLLLDAKGAVQLSKTGTLSAAERKQLLDRLAALLAP